jgi:HK97 family phage major capsid protein
VAASTTTASELTAEQVQSILVRPLEDASQFLAAGPRIFDTDGSPVRIPKLGATDAPSWHAENEEIDEVEQAFDEITLLPSTMKSVKTLTRYSNELARQSVIALDATLRERLVRAVADKLDHAFIHGDGGSPAGTEPVGLLNYSDTQEVPVSGVLELDDLLDAWGLALAANVNMGSLRWWMRPETFTALRKLKDDMERYQLQPDPTADGVFRLFGAPVTVSSRIPSTDGATTVVLADFSQIAVARDQSPTVKILDQTFGNFDQMAIRVTARYDAAPMNPEAVVLLTGVDTDGTAGS